MADLPRRKFLKTIGSVAVASALPARVLNAQSQPPSIALFAEPDFPVSYDGQVQLDLLQRVLRDFRVVVLNERDLIAQLDATRFDLLITAHGSCFPKAAWGVLLKYFRDGGNWLNIGGVPLMRPVVRAGREWRMEDPQATYHKRLGITHSFPVDVSKVTAYKTAPELSHHSAFSNQIKPKQIHELYVRLSSSSNEPDEAGSDGPHEGVVRPLLFAHNEAGRAIAAPIIEIDRWTAEFAGGRWVFANFDGQFDSVALLTMVQRALQGASRFEVKSDFASYQPGETPTLSVELLRPKRDFEKLALGSCFITLGDPNQNPVPLRVTLTVDGARAVGSLKLSNAGQLKPGFYRAQATLNFSSQPLTHTTGFWIYDEALLAQGKPLTAEKHLFYRDGQVFPVTGTTYMASDKHRRYLFEPNAFVWDNDFREMKAAGVNMVRTGIWTGWKKYMTEPGKVNEATLRAFDAFLLTAHKHDIPVIFTFFAFLPETWGGENAYLDPRAVKAQQQFISAFTERCRRVDDVVWDFINEPSFCSPKYLWNCRPNYDAHEKAAWKQWLRNRYPAATDEDHVSQLREVWRASGDEVLELPRLQDFESVHLIDDRLPLKTLDYRLFAQDMFIRWVRQMTTAIRSNGNSKQLITVGQDEAGLGDSPNIQFFANEIDFTSLHNWWANDDLVWDSVLAKAPSKLSLMEETGVMFYEKSDGGEPWRSEDEASHLLERKLALSFAADGAGFIEWIWNTNPYMNSTNEVGIGFHRVDGSAKPELEPFLRIAKFMAQYGQHLRERATEPVAMVIPHSHMFAPRNFAYEATRRCVRAMYYHCGVSMQAISEYTLAEYSGQAKLLIVPAPRVLTQSCWEKLKQEQQRGAVVAISGAFYDDEHWRDVPRLPDPLRHARNVSITPSESIHISGQEYLIRYDGEKLQRIEKAVVKSAAGLPLAPIVAPNAAGQLVWSTLPLELGDSMPALVAFYKLAMSQAHITPVFTAAPVTPAVLILPSIFRDVVLYTFISETDRDTPMQVIHRESRTPFTVSVPAQRSAMVLLDRRTGRIIGRM